MDKEKKLKRYFHSQNWSSWLYYHCSHCMECGWQQYRILRPKRWNFVTATIVSSVSFTDETIVACVGNKYEREENSRESDTEELPR